MKADIRTIARRLWGEPVSAPGARALLWIGLIDSLGSGLYLAGSALYFSLVIRLSAGQIGLGLTAAALLGFFAQPLIGWMADKFGARRVLVLLHLWRAAAFIALLMSRDFEAFVASAAAIGIGQQALSPVYQSLVAEVVGAEKRLPIMAKSRTVYNVGFSLGGLASTAAIATGSELAFESIIVGNALACVIAAVLLVRVSLGREQRSATTAGVKYPFRLRSLQDGKYVFLAGLNGVLTLHVSLLSVGVPLWVVTHTSAPRATVGLLLVLNTVLAVLFQVVASVGSDTVSGGSRALQKGGIALIISCILFAVSGLVHNSAGAVILVLIGVAAMTSAELYQSAGGWGLSYALAPTGAAQGEYLSTFNLGVSAQYVIGPTILTWGVLGHGTYGWLGLIILIAVVTASVGPVARAAAERVQMKEAL